MTTTTQRVRDYYEATLLDYRILWMDRRTRAMHFGSWGDGAKTHAQSLDAMNALLARTAGIQPGDRVLDAGCGVGGTSLWLARELGAAPTGITPVPVQVRRARRYARMQQHSHPTAPHARFWLADYATTPFIAGSFDAVIALESVCHAGDKQAFFGEAARLLRPGGRLAVAEYVRADGSPRDGPGVDTAMATWLAGWSMPWLATRAELAEMARHAGFARVTTADITPSIARSSRRMYQISRYLSPLQWWLHTIHLRSDRQQAHVQATLSQYRALKARLWRYVILSGTKPAEPPQNAEATSSP